MYCRIANGCADISIANPHTSNNKIHSLFIVLIFPYYPHLDSGIICVNRSRKRGAENIF
jgi:hypothetical protein